MTPVLSLEAALERPHFRECKTVVHSEHPCYGTVTHLASPVRISDFTFTVARQAPLPGQDTDEVLRQTGFNVQQIEHLHALGAVA